MLDLAFVDAITTAFLLDYYIFMILSLFCYRGLTISLLIAYTGVLYALVPLAILILSGIGLAGWVAKMPMGMVVLNSGLSGEKENKSSLYQSFQIITFRGISFKMILICFLKVLLSLNDIYVCIYSHKVN